MMQLYLVVALHTILQWALAIVVVVDRAARMRLYRVE